MILLHRFILLEPFFILNTIRKSKLTSGRVKKYCSKVPLDNSTIAVYMLKVPVRAKWRYLFVEPQTRHTERKWSVESLFFFWLQEIRHLTHFARYWTRLWKATRQF